MHGNLSVDILCSEKRRSANNFARAKIEETVGFEEQIMSKDNWRLKSCKSLLSLEYFLPRAYLLKIGEYHSNIRHFSRGLFGNVTVFTIPCERKYQNKHQ